MVMATAIFDRVAPVTFNHNSNVGFIKKKHHHGATQCQPTAKQLIGNALRHRVENIDHEFCEPGDEDTFFVADLGEVYRQQLRWKMNLPRVKPFYGKSRSPPRSLDPVCGSCMLT